MANRWTAAELARLRDLAARFSAPEIAEKLDRSVGGVVFKAQQINVALKNRCSGRADFGRGSSSPLGPR